MQKAVHTFQRYEYRFGCRMFLVPVPVRWAAACVASQRQTAGKILVDWTSACIIENLPLNGIQGTSSSSMEAAKPYPKHPWLETALSLLEGRQKRETTDAILAEELSRLSVKERNRVNEDILGIFTPPDETNDFVEESLHGLEEALSKVPIELGKAYQLALRQSPDYVKDSNFQLKFLRAERFDADLAATRMAKYFKFILENFGEEALCRPLTLKDLDFDDMTDLKRGNCQMLQERDSAGRSIFCYKENAGKPNEKEYKTGTSLAKVVFFIMCLMAEDLETSRRGAVFLKYFRMDFPFKFDLDKEQRSAEANDAAPLAFAASHICLFNPFLKRIMSPILDMYRSSDIQRAQIHLASNHMECMHTLMCQGIPVDYIPITESGNVKTRRHLKWIQGIRTREISIHLTGSFVGIDLPMPQDVLGGQGKGTYQHRGNKTMKELVESVETEYFDADIHQRKVLCLQVVEAVQESGGRFLEQKKDGFWEEIPTAKAMERVKICFKNSRFGKMRRKQTPQDISGPPAPKRPKGCGSCF